MSDRLATQLRDEAQSATPAFSDALHAQTMLKIHRVRRDALAGSQRAPSRLPLFGLTGVAAALIVAVGTWWWMPDYSSDTPMQLSSLVETLQESTSPIQEQFTRPLTGPGSQLTLLQDDARTFGQFLAEQIDVLPRQEDPSL